MLTMYSAGRKVCHSVSPTLGTAEFFKTTVLNFAKFVRRLPVKASHPKRHKGMLMKSTLGVNTSHHHEAIYTRLSQVI